MKFSQWLLEATTEMKQRLMQFLGQHFKGYEDWANDAEIAIYYFANHHHRGQWSDLYSILSTSPYRPGPMMTLEKEDETVQDMYKALEQEFGGG